MTSNPHCVHANNNKMEALTLKEGKRILLIDSLEPTKSPAHKQMEILITARTNKYKLLLCQA